MNPSAEALVAALEDQREVLRELLYRTEVETRMLRAELAAAKAGHKTREMREIVQALFCRVQVLEAIVAAREPRREVPCRRS